MIGPLLPSSGEHVSGMHARTQVGLTRHRVAICVAHPKAAFMNNCLAPCWAVFLLSAAHYACGRTGQHHRDLVSAVQRV